MALAAPGSSPDLILHPRASSGPRANPPTSASRDPSAPGPTLSAETLHLPKRPVSLFKPRLPRMASGLRLDFQQPVSGQRLRHAQHGARVLLHSLPPRCWRLPPSSGPVVAAFSTLLFPSLCTRDLSADPTNSTFKTQPESSHVLSRHPSPPSRRPTSFLIGGPDQPPNWSSCVLTGLPDICSQDTRQAAGMLRVKCRSDHVSHLCSKPSSGFSAQSKSQSLPCLTSQTPFYRCILSRCAVPAPRAVPLPQDPCTCSATSRLTAPAGSALAFFCPLLESSLLGDVIVWVCQGSRNKVPRAEWLGGQKWTVLWIWRLQVPDQGAG